MTEFDVHVLTNQLSKLAVLVHMRERLVEHRAAELAQNLVLERERIEMEERVRLASAAATVEAAQIAARSRASSQPAEEAS